jgi:hypothetical protein
MKSVFSIRLTEFERKELGQISKTEKSPVGKLIRESIDRFIAVKRFRQLRSKALTFAEKKGIYTDEDAFKVFER